MYVRLYGRNWGSNEQSLRDCLLARADMRTAENDETGEHRCKVIAFLLPTD